MADKVVDASAIAAVLFGEAEGSAVMAEIAHDALFAPSLLDYELANICVVKSRRSPELRASIVANFRRRGELGIEMRKVDHDGAVEIAAASGLSGYDASYLWLARTLGVELVTLDRRLARVAAETTL